MRSDDEKQVVEPTQLVNGIHMVRDEADAVDIRVVCLVEVFRSDDDGGDSTQELVVFVLDPQMVTQIVFWTARSSSDRAMSLPP